MTETQAPTDPTIREALAVHNMLRKLQFTPDEMFIMWSPEQIHVLLKAQGLKFGIYVGPSSFTGEEEFRPAWKKAVEWWNTAPEQELQDLYDSAGATSNGTAFIQALVDYGFTFNNVQVEESEQDKTLN